MMDDFLGTSIQYSERQIKRLEAEHAAMMVCLPYCYNVPNYANCTCRNGESRS